MGKILQFHSNNKQENVTPEVKDISFDDLMAIKLIVATGKVLTETEFSNLPTRIQQRLVIEQMVFLIDPEDYIHRFEKEVKK